MGHKYLREESFYGKTPEVKIRWTFQFQISSYYWYVSKRRKKMEKKEINIFYPKIGSVVVEGNVRGIVERPGRTVIRGTFFVGFRSLYNACSNFSF